MKILCIADHIDPLVYSDSIKSRFKDIDLVLSSGDLPLNYYDYIVSMLNKPLLFVFGNHNLKQLKFYQGKGEISGFSARRPVFKSVGATYINGKVMRKSGLIIAGLGGSMWYNGGPNQHSDTGMFFKVLQLIPMLLINRFFFGRFIDILITHAPPCGIHDKPDRAHTGFKALRWFMRVFKPRYLIHGHVHLWDRAGERQGRYYDTEVVNAYDHCIIEMEN
jgi:hypothetical protein